MTIGHYMRILGFDVIMNAWMEDVSEFLALVLVQNNLFLLIYFASKISWEKVQLYYKFSIIVGKQKDVTNKILD